MLASPVAQTVQNLPAMQGSWVLSLDQEDGSLEEGMTTHPSDLAWRISRAEEPGGATVHGAAKSQTRLRDEHFHFHWSFIVDLQCCVSFQRTAKWFSYTSMLFQILSH